MIQLILLGLTLAILIVLVIEVVFLRSEIKREQFLRREMIANVTDGVAANNSRLAKVYSEIVELRARDFTTENELNDFWREIGWSAARDRGRYRIQFLPVMVPKKDAKPVPAK